MESLKNKILTELNDSSVDFSTRCNNAHVAFISSSLDLPLLNKEELILEWIASNLSKSVEEYSCGLRLLVKCLKSHHLMSFTKVVSPEPCLKFLKKAKKNAVDIELQTQLRDCTKLMMSLTCFQPYFKNDVNALTKAVSLHYSAVALCGHHENDKCGFYPELLTQLYNEMVFKEDFAIQFLDKVMPAIFSIPSSVCKCPTSNQMSELMSQVFFNDARIVAEILSLEKYLTHPTFLASARPVIQAIVRTLSETVITNDENAMATFFSAFLSLFMKKTKACKFKFFISLCSALGFKSEQEGIRFESKVNCQKGLKILLAMINQLLLSEVSFVVSESSKTFFDWLISLLKLIMSPAFGISAYVLSIIQSVLNFIPVIFTHVIPQFVEYIMIPQKDDNIKQLYALTLNSVMDIFQKLTRISKLFDVMIETISLQSKNNPVLLPPCTVMLPLEFKINFEALVMEMSTSQSFTTIASLLSHLNNEIAEPLAISKERIEAGQLTVLEFITVLLECLMRNTKILTKSQSPKCYHLLASMASILKRIGQAMLKQKFNLKFNELFLKLCRVWGDNVVLIKNYDDTNGFENALMDHSISSFQINDSDPVNNRWDDISYTFKFLNATEWNFIGERVCNFSYKGSMDDFFTMVIQNLNMLKLADILTENKTTVTLNNIFSFASPNWLWNNLYNYISYIDEKSVLDLVKVMVDPEKSNSFSHFEKICKLQSLDGNEGRMLIVLLGLRWLREIGKILNRLGMDKTQNLLDVIGTEKHVVLSELFHGTFFNNSMSESDTDDDDDDATTARMKVKNYGDEIMEQFLVDLSEPKCVVDISGNDFQQIQSFLDLIYSLKITGLSPASCKLILFGALSVLRELSQQSRKPPQLLFTIISEILVKNIHLGGDLWLNTEFFQWLYNTYEEQSQKKIIFSLVCDFIVRKSNVTEEFVESIVRNLELAPLVMSAYIKQQQNLKRKRKDFEEEVPETKQNLENCMKVVRRVLKQSVREEGVQAVQLHAFSLFLKHSIHTKDVKKIEWCSKHLSAFLNIGFLNLSNPVSTDITRELLLIETVFSNWAMFRNKLEQGTHVTLWKSLTTKANLCSSCMQLMLEALNTEEYVKVLDAMKEETIKNNTVDTNLISLDKAWKVVISAKVNAEKIKKRLAYKDFLESEFSSLAAKWVTAPPETSSVKAVFSIVTTIVRTPTIRIGPENLDIIFVLMSVLPSNDFEALNTGFKLLGNLLTKRSSIVLMHLPSFLQRYRYFIMCVVKASSEEVPEYKMASLYKCTNVIEELALAMVSHKVEFAPFVPNIIGDILHLYEVETVTPNVKRSLIHAINAFLNICSQKKVDYLLQVLSPASKGIFKNILKNYNKFHRYHGKI